MMNEGFQVHNYENHEKGMPDSEKELDHFSKALNLAETKEEFDGLNSEDKAFTRASFNAFVSQGLGVPHETIIDETIRNPLRTRSNTFVNSGDIYGRGSRPVQNESGNHNSDKKSFKANA
jgi:hypothetical protein